MHPTDSIESLLYEHVLGNGSPHPTLLSTGVLSDGWTDTYLQLLKEVVEGYEGRDSLPRDVVAAVHFASFYLNIRYDAWREIKGGQRNVQTERNLGRLRIPSEFLLLSGVIDRERTNQSS